MVQIQQIQEFPPLWHYPDYVPGQRVGLFIPCFMDHFFPSAARATLSLLEQQNIEVYYPTGQTCCGQPAFNSGYWPDASCVAEKMVRLFQDCDWVVCPSGACTSMARVSFRQLEKTPGQLSDVGSRVVELTEFLVEILHVTDVGASFNHRVTMHNGCHGRRELGLGPQALQLLSNVKGLQYTELPDAEDCCGFGGTFSVKIPNLSVDMGKTKCENIASTGAEFVTSIDSSCLMHIAGVLNTNPQWSTIRTIHIAEILTSHE